MQTAWRLIRCIPIRSVPSVTQTYCYLCPYVICRQLLCRCINLDLCFAIFRKKLSYYTFIDVISFCLTAYPQITMIVISRQLHWIEQSIKNVLDDTDNQDMCFVSDKDIHDCFEEDQVLVLEAPLGANLSVGSLPTKVWNKF